MGSIARRIIAFIAATLVVATAFAQKTNADREENARQMRKLNQVYQYIALGYVDSVSMSPLVERAIEAMLQELDPHSAYIPAKELSGVNEQLDGEFSGIGIEFRVVRDTIAVTNTILGAPAANVGILPNDRIVAIDGKRVIGIKSGDVPSLLRGKTGSKVDVAVVRQGAEEEMIFSLTRERIPLHTVDAAYRIDNHTGYIKISRFGRTTASEFADAMRSLGGIRSLILDLRGNGGGVMSGAVEIAEKFLPAGATIVSTEDRAGNVKHVRSRTEGHYASMGVAVLIDENSASASEILAGALQDWDRAIIIGRSSFGKGLVQRQFELADQSAVRITVARYLTPSGRVIQRPYEKGHRKEYYRSHFDRLYHPDSVKVDTTARKTYRTLISRREIFSGEGIAPDIEIAADTTTLSRYAAGVVGRGILQDYTYDYIAANIANLTELYTDFELFEKKFTIDSSVMSGLSERAQEAGVVMEGVDDEASDAFLRRHIKALIARRLFSPAAYYRVIINKQDDAAFARAVEVMSDWKTNRKAVLGH